MATVLTERLTYGVDACTSDGAIALVLNSSSGLDCFRAGIRDDGTTSTATGNVAAVD